MLSCLLHISLNVKNIHNINYRYKIPYRFVQVGTIAHACSSKTITALVKKMLMLSNADIVIYFFKLIYPMKKYLIYIRRIMYYNVGKRKEEEMFYLTTHSTHFYLVIYGVRHMVNDHSDSERGNPLPLLHGLLFLIRSKSTFIYTILQTG